MKLWIKIILILLVIVGILIVLSLTGILDGLFVSEAQAATRTTASGINDATDAIKDAVN